MFAADEEDFKCLLFDAQSCHESFVCAAKRRFEDGVSFSIARSSSFKSYFLFTFRAKLNMRFTSLRNVRNMIDVKCFFWGQSTGDDEWDNFR